MKLSIVISVYNSHEILRRQVLNWNRLGLPNDVEVLIMDDSSQPPLVAVGENFNLRIIPVGLPRDDSDGIFHDGRVSIARNMGARLARGEFLLMTDIDYIIRKADIEAGLKLQHDKQSFRRQFGVLLEDGTVTQDFDVLRQYGLTEKRIKERGLNISPHPNNFIMRKTVFEMLGGYAERAERIYPSRDDGQFKGKWVEAERAGRVTIAPERTTILMFPNGQFCGDLDYNPFGLFHNLSRKTRNNPYNRTA